MNRNIWLEVCDACGVTCETEKVTETDLLVINHLNDFYGRASRNKGYQGQSCSVLMQEQIPDGREITLLEIPIV